MMINSSHKQVIRNTIYLYIRMVVVLLVTLYTSRVVLDYLGTTDYGIYSLVSGLVIFFTFISNAMQVSIQRTLAYELGKPHESDYTAVFSSIFLLMLGIISVLVIGLLCVGFSTFASGLSLPIERLEAAKYVYYVTIFQLFSYAVEIPFSCNLIAREQLKKYSAINIAGVFIKLAAVFILVVEVPFDKLVFYSLLNLAGTFLIAAIYLVDYFRHKNTLSFRNIDQLLLKGVVRYSGWNLLGGLANMGLNQGVNVLLNIFWGPIANAARAISFQVQYTINGFATNIRLAINPQLIKNYAKGSGEQMTNLLLFTMKISPIIILLISVPFFFRAEYVLTLWLGKVPEFTVSLTKVFLISGIVDSVAGVMHTTVQAQSSIRNYQLVSSGTLLLTIPLSWLLLRLGYPPDSTVYAYIAISLLVIGERCFFLKKMLKDAYARIKNQILLGLIVVPVISFLLPAWIDGFIPQTFVGLILFSLVTNVYISLVSWFILLSAEDRTAIVGFASRKIKASLFRK